MSLGEDWREWLFSVHPLTRAGPAHTAYILLETTDYKLWQRLLRQPQITGFDRTGGRSERARLTPRELEALEWIGQGKTSKEIASSLGMSVLTVGNHRKQICRKLELHSTLEVASYAASLHASPSTAEAHERSLLSPLAAI